MKTVMRHGNCLPLSSFSLRFLACFFLTLSSCMDHTTDPVASSPFTTAPGIQLTQTGEASQIGWLQSGNVIAYNALTLDGSMMAGTVKSVNCDSKMITVLDATRRDFNQFQIAGDSVFYVTLNLDNSTSTFLRSGISVQPTESLTHWATVSAVISPYRNLVAVNGPIDSVFVISTKTLSQTSFALHLYEYPMLFSPDSKKLLLSSGRILDLTDGSSTNLPSPLPQYPMLIRWNETGLWELSCTQDTLPTYYLTNLLNNTSTAILHAPSNTGYSQMCAWSSDNKKIAIIRMATLLNTVPAVMNLYVYDMTTQTVKFIVGVNVRIHNSNLAGLNSFSFSPDGKKIAYSVEGNIYYQNL